MQLLDQNDTYITLCIEPSEALAINNALNESLEAFDDDNEFETRMGVTKAVVITILDTLNRLWEDEAGPRPPT